MAAMLSIKTLARVKERFATNEDAMRRRITVGLKRCGLLLQRASQEIVPVDTGNLKNSSFTRSSGDNTDKPEVTVGYTANYGIYVHENLDARHKEGKQAKFLEEPARTKVSEMRAELLAAVNRE